MIKMLLLFVVLDVVFMLRSRKLKYLKISCSLLEHVVENSEAMSMTSRKGARICAMEEGEETGEKCPPFALKRY